jgi:hypothetical protein
VGSQGCSSGAAGVGCPGTAAGTTIAGSGGAGLAAAGRPAGVAEGATGDGLGEGEGAGVGGWADTRAAPRAIAIVSKVLVKRTFEGLGLASVGSF